MFVSTGGGAAATILHADLDAFYASVEQRDAPELRGRPVIVGGGVVLAASYEAKDAGVRTAMNGRQARALCPDAVVVRPRMEAYSAASKDVFAIFRDTTPLVEGLSVDEAFLEVGGLARLVGTPKDIAARLRGRVLAEVGLPITVGVARTKFLAKVASGVAKPDGLLVVDPDREREFLHPLRVERLWGVGRVTAGRLHALGIHTVADVADLGEPSLVSLLGRAAGRHIHALATFSDPRAVTPGVRRRSIGSQRALGRGRRSPEELDTILAGIVDRLGRRLRDGDRACRTVVLRLRFDDFARVTRSVTLRAATTQTAPIDQAARDLLGEAMPMILDRGITLIGLSLANLSGEDREQLELPLDAREEPRSALAGAGAGDAPRDAAALDRTLDAVRARFGAASVNRATQLGRDPGTTVPVLPEHE
ncbi:MAG TPA: DNA polymerase IV [Actinomycetospora sp.]|uniref:DNA polymerase IV n=1 Tax=Actinomycetospora sp. TaxID=1872135 RepID=UPI002F3E24B3